MLTPKKISKLALLCLALASYGLYGLLETSQKLNPWYQDKYEAASIMKASIELIQKESERRGLIPDAHYDPNRTGLIGPESTLITTDKGVLDAKVMVTNPNFAAAVVDMFKRAGVESGDVIAVSYTGSMPGANLAVLSACEALKLDPIIISSMGASSWGATHPNFTWLDMEQHLLSKGIVSKGSIASSMGGSSDVGANLDESGKALLMDAVLRNKVEFVHEESLDESIDKRIEIYNKHAGNRPIKLFVNIGGGIVSLGARSNGALLKPGLNKVVDTSVLYPRGLMVYMADRNIPIVHLLKVRQIINDYELSRFPVPLPAVGEGRAFYEERLNPKSILLMLLIILVVCTIIVELDVRIIPELSKRMRKRSRK